MTPANRAVSGSVPGSRRSPREENDYPLQYSCLGNSVDRGARRATVHGSRRAGHDLATKQHHHPDWSYLSGEPLNQKKMNRG